MSRENCDFFHNFPLFRSQLRELKPEIKPLNIKAAYQRPCSSRLSPGKYHFVADIFDLIGVEMVDREYQGENALCCGEPIRIGDLYETANDVQKRNIDDMVKNDGMSKAKPTHIAAVIIGKNPSRKPSRSGRKASVRKRT